MEVISRITALILIIILFPVFLFVTFFSLFFQGLPIYYLHSRVGYKYRNFNVIKFRTMSNSNINTENITSLNDPRMTKWGRILRYFKIDEIPQLINIIKGDMRFIGPRPEVEEFINNHDFSFLGKFKPGLSDFSSIIFRNEQKVLNNLGGTENYSSLLLIKLELCHFYVKNKSFLLDFVLTIVTILSIFIPNAMRSFILHYYLKDFDNNLKNKIYKLID